MKHIAVGAVFALLMIVLTGICFADGFSNDPDAIESAAKSVMMLEVYDSSNELYATGSGFVCYDSCTMITNYHVIENAGSVIAYSDDGEKYLLDSVLIADEAKDIAICSFASPTDIKPLTINTTGEHKRAESVVAIGSPIGITNTVSLGNISAMYDMDDVSYIQFTAPISHGSSGGALFNDNGEVIGITSASVVYEEAQNINLAIDALEIDDVYNSWTGTRMSFSEYATFGIRTDVVISNATLEDGVCKFDVTNNTGITISQFDFCAAAYDADDNVILDVEYDGNEDPETFCAKENYYLYTINYVEKIKANETVTVSFTTKNLDFPQNTANYSIAIVSYYDETDDRFDIPENMLTFYKTDGTVIRSKIQESEYEFIDLTTRSRIRNLKLVSWATILEIFSNFYNRPAGDYLYEVDEENAFGKAGLKAGDEIIKINGVSVHDGYVYEYAVMSLIDGNSIEVEYYRDGEYYTAEVKPEDLIITLDADEDTEAEYTELSLGSKGDDVKRLQEALIELGYLSGSADGDYGKKTQKAVAAFNEMNLNDDLAGKAIKTLNGSVAGVETQRCLFSGKAVAKDGVKVYLYLTGKLKYSYLSAGLPRFSVQMDMYTNEKSAVAYTLSIYATDTDGNIVISPFEKTFDNEISDESYIDLDLGDTENIKTISCAISSVEYSDGTSYVPESDNIQYMCWELL